MCVLRQINVLSIYTSLLKDDLPSRVFPKAKGNTQNCFALTLEVVAITFSACFQTSCWIALPRKDFSRHKIYIPGFSIVLHKIGIPGFFFHDTRFTEKRSQEARRRFFVEEGRRYCHVEDLVTKNGGTFRLGPELGTLGFYFSNNKKWLFKHFDQVNLTGGRLFKIILKELKK